VFGDIWSTCPIKIYEYFSKRNPREWNIIDFLNECNPDTYQQIIERYLSSLEEIIKSKEGVEREKAQKLFDKYKKSSSRVRHRQSPSLSDGSRLDRTLARNWWDERTRSFEVDQLSIHLHFTGIGTVNGNTGNVNVGIIDTISSVSKKRKFLEIDESNTTNTKDINKVDVDNIINDEQVKGHNLEESW
ncbi:13781_t:CDS:2, partial [Acaulospora morrowiae]